VIFISIAAARLDMPSPHIEIVLHAWLARASS
jgi:hypothetical protein